MSSWEIDHRRSAAALSRNGFHRDCSPGGPPALPGQRVRRTRRRLRPWRPSTPAVLPNPLSRRAARARRASGSLAPAWCPASGRAPDARRASWSEQPRDERWCWCIAPTGGSATTGQLESEQSDGDLGLPVGGHAVVDRSQLRSSQLIVPPRAAMLVCEVTRARRHATAASGGP